VSDLARLRIWDDPAIRGALSYARESVGISEQYARE
jgi:hypothetical protein